MSDTPITLDSTFFETLLERVVLKVMSALPTIGCNRLAYNEKEAADLLGVKNHVLRDARRQRMIGHTKVGGRIAYTRQQLMDYLESQSV